jgi:hypothetical protein
MLSKGNRTIGYQVASGGLMIAAAVTPLLLDFEWTALGFTEAHASLVLLAVGIADRAFNVFLRMITTTPVGSEY